MNFKKNYEQIIPENIDWAFIVVLIGILLTPYFQYSFIISIIACMFIDDEDFVK